MVTKRYVNISSIFFKRIFLITTFSKIRVPDLSNGGAKSSVVVLGGPIIVLGGPHKEEAWLTRLGTGHPHLGQIIEINNDVTRHC